MPIDFPAPEPPHLPRLDDFSPSIVGGRLKSLLEIVRDFEGDGPRIEAQIGTLGSLRLNPGETRSSSQATRLYNVRLSMSHVGLIDTETKSRLTELGRMLLAMESDDEIHRAFARHLLENHFGWDLIEIAKSLRGPGSLAPYPGDDAFLASLRLRTEVSTNRKDFTKIRIWLELSEVVRPARGRDIWHVDEDRLAQLTGLTSDQWTQWMSLSLPQQHLLRAIHQQALMSLDRWVDGKTAKRICENDVAKNIFPDASFRRDIVSKLVDGEWVEEQHRTSEADRGGNLGKFRATDKLMEVVPNLPEKVNRLSKISAELLIKLARPLDQILTELRTGDTNTKGIALELLALKLATQIDLIPFDLRFRDPSGTGDAEVDLVADRTGLHYSRWVFQCKNVGSPGIDARTISVGVLAKEVGLAEILKAHVVVIVTTGKFGEGAARYVQALARASALQIVLLDGEDLNRYEAQGPSYVIGRLEEQARYNRWLKRSQLLPGDSEAVPLGD